MSCEHISPRVQSNVIDEFPKRVHRCTGVFYIVDLFSHQTLICSSHTLVFLIWVYSHISITLKFILHKYIVIEKKTRYRYVGHVVY